jgi:hypothetical protein
MFFGMASNLIPCPDLASFDQIIGMMSSIGVVGGSTLIDSPCSMRPRNRGIWWWLTPRLLISHFGIRITLVNFSLSIVVC